MKKGIIMSEAAKLAKTDTRTMKKVMKILGVLRKKKKGKVYIVTEYYKKLIDKMIYLMCGGWSASHAARELHTTLKTMMKMSVLVDGRARPLLETSGGRHILNVYKVYGYPTTFYGKLHHDKEDERGVKTKSILTTRMPTQKEPPNDDDYPEDDYASVLWQIDFDPFHSTLMEHDVIEHYPPKILKWLREELVNTTTKAPAKISAMHRAHQHTHYVDEKLKETGGTLSLLDDIFKNIIGTDFSDIIQCGIEDRGITEKYMTPADFNTYSKKVDDGHFVVNVWRAGGRHWFYPNPPLVMKYEHDLKDESKVKRKMVVRLSA